MSRSLLFSREEGTLLRLAPSMEHAVLEVLSVPEDYPDAAAQEIAQSVFASGAVESRARAGTRGGPIRITWDALVERGMARGVLARE